VWKEQEGARREESVEGTGGRERREKEEGEGRREEEDTKFSSTSRGPLHLLHPPLREGTPPPLPGG
jgi:hypothetical protein